MAVAPEVRATGVGRALVAATEVEARRVGIPVLFAWTYEVGFFERCGSAIDKTRELHPRVWSECLRCPFYVGCTRTGSSNGWKTYRSRSTCPNRSCTGTARHTLS